MYAHGSVYPRITLSELQRFLAGVQVNSGVYNTCNANSRSTLDHCVTVVVIAVEVEVAVGVY